MTHQQSPDAASWSSVNDNAPKAVRGKRGKNPSSSTRLERNGYSPEIKALIEEIKKIQGRELEARVEIGLGLLQAKKLLAHGQFRPWVLREFRWSERTATNYIKLAQHYEGKTAKFADLDLGTALALVADSTLEKVRDEVFNRADNGEKIIREDVRKQIAEVKSAARKQISQQKTATPNDEKKTESLHAAGKSPAEAVAQAMLNLIQALEKNGLHCKPNDVAKLLLNGENERLAPNVGQCADFVNHVATGLAVSIPPEPDVVSELRALAS